MKGILPEIVQISSEIADYRRIKWSRTLVSNRNPKTSIERWDDNHASNSVQKYIIAFYLSEEGPHIGTVHQFIN